ncbi:MAG: pyridoxamine 5'-phosphate oxidase family protein [Oscillospiraceae bacterium]|nr:pyridoxamine 5'-phosphate oxidase family protein [Oscillospiraceae bacterium]
MFRELTRTKTPLTEEECKDLLKTELRGVLSVMGDNDYPYGLPINFLYNEETGKIYFHSGRTGYKLEAIQRNSKVSFCVYDKGFRKEGDWALNIKSVVAFGKIRIIDSREENDDIMRKLSYRFTDDSKFIEFLISEHGDEVLCFEMTIEHMTGKMVYEK